MHENGHDRVSCFYFGFIESRDYHSRIIIMVNDKIIMIAREREKKIEIKEKTPLISSV